MVPPPLSPPLCTLPPGPGPPRFVCYCEGEGSGTGERGGFNLYVTDAAELWSTCFTPDSLAALLLQRRQPPAPGRAPGRWALCSSYRVRPVTCDLGRVTQFPQNKPQAPERGSVCVEKGLWPWDPARFRSPPLPHPVFPRPGCSERWPWTWGQEAVSGRVSHQPWLQE
ncbi:protein PAXX isoform 6-T6 [Megaptera novaeangliae]